MGKMIGLGTEACALELDGIKSLVCEMELELDGNDLEGVGLPFEECFEGSGSARFFFELLGDFFEFLECLEEEGGGSCFEKGWFEGLQELVC